MPKNKKSARRNRKKAIKNIPDQTQAVSIKKTELALAGAGSFFIDTVPSESIRKTTGERREVARRKVLHSDLVLAPNPWVKPLKGVQKPKIIESSCEKKEIARVRKAIIQNRHQSNQLQAKTPAFDLWADEPKPEEDKEQPWIEEPKRRRFQPSSSTSLPQVTPAENGISYNPLPSSHKDLIAKAVQEQLEKRTEMNRVLRDVNPKVEIKPMTEGEMQAMYDQSSSSEEEEFDGPKEKVVVDHVFRLTRADINRKKRRLQGEAAHQRNLRKKQRQATLDRLPEIIQEVDDWEEEKKQRAERRAKRKIEQRAEPKRLGKEKYKKPDIEVLCTDELPNSLRQLPSKYSLLEDRLDNARKRNLVETRSKKFHFRRYEKKATTLYRSRDWMVQQEKLYANWKPPTIPVPAEPIEEAEDSGKD